MKKKEYKRQLLIEKIKQTRQGRKIIGMENLPFKAIEELYEARVKNFELSPDEFNKWLLDKSFYANGVNLSIIAYVLNITTERARQIEFRAIKKMNHPLIGKPLKDYVELSVNSEI